ncbi:MAG: hypothetical protein ACK5GN_10620 [Pseudomonadota bacterium]
MLVKLTRPVSQITIGCCFDSYPCIDSVSKSRHFAIGFWRSL